MAGRRARRRRFGLALLPLVLVLLAIALLFGHKSGAASAVSLAALAYGIGLLVAATFLIAGHNPLDRRRRNGS